MTWNIYGTLLAISGGELHFEHPQKFIMELALDKTVQEFKMWASMTRKPGQPAEYIGQLYRKALDEQRLAPSPGEKHPEMIAERVWEDILKKLLQKDYKFDAGFFGSLNEYSRKIAYFFHASLQGTACYPGAAGGPAIRSQPRPAQGLLADGQCFTLVQLQRGLAQQGNKAGSTICSIPTCGCCPAEQGGRKPSERLFRHLVEPWKPPALSRRRCCTSARASPRTLRRRVNWACAPALFAGDKASLQATPEQLKDAASRPDVLLTELSQIAEVV